MGIILSLLGLLGAGQDVAMPMMMRFQKQVFSQIQEVHEKETRRNGSASSRDEDFDRMAESMEKMWNTPVWFGAWSVLFGVIKLMVCGFGLFAYISLLQVKPYAVKFVYWALGLAIGLTLIKGAVSVASMSFMVMAMGIGSIFGLMVNIVLLIVVGISDKSAYRQAAHPGA